MLIEFFGRNFRCFRDEFRLSMLATDIDPDSDKGIVEVEVEGEEKPLRLLRTVGIYGPNASGKSTVLLAAAELARLMWFTMFSSSDAPIDSYNPFLLDDNGPKSPVMLGLRAVVDRREYEYKVEFDATQFISESLVQVSGKGESVLFERHGQSVTGTWTSQRQFKILKQKFRPNALLLALADSLAPSLAKKLAVGLQNLLLNITSPLVRYRTENAPAEWAHKDPDGFGAWLSSWIANADFGVSHYDVEAVAKPNASDLADVLTGRRRAEGYKLSLFHHGPAGTRKIDYWSESVGTRRFIELAPIIHDLTHGDTVRAYFVDELGASLHPQLLETLLRELNECPMDRVRGQLIFATHENALIDGEARDAVLRRDQIYLTEKDADGAARLYSVADFKERNNLNLRRRYLQGRYGALPSLGPLGIDD